MTLSLANPSFVVLLSKANFIFAKHPDRDGFALAAARLIAAVDDILKND